MSKLSITYLKVLSLSFAIALLFTTAALPYYNAISGNEIVVSEEESENECSSRPILEELEVALGLSFKSKTNGFMLLSTNNYNASIYKTVYIAVFSPPPEFDTKLK